MSVDVGLEEPEAQGTAHAVAVQVLRHGPIPRSRVARRLGLSNGSLTRLSRPLLDSGLIVETAAVTDPDSRRPTRPLDVVAERHRFVGVNLSGVAAWAVLTDMRTTVLAESKVDLLETTPAAVVRTITSLVAELAGDGSGAPVDGVGVALGGYVHPAGVVQDATFLGWRDPVPLEDMVAAACGRPVVVGNDLAALTRSEHWFGEGRHCPSFAVVTVGAGVGYGLVLHDRLVETTDTGLQLLGHHPLNPGGPRCPEGHRGCATSELTIPAVESAASLALGRPTTYPDVLSAADAGDRRATQVLDDATHHLGMLLGVVANTTSITRVVLAGEGAGYAVRAEQALRAGIDACRDPRATALEIVHRRHDFSAWARGAAGMAAHAYASSSRWLA